MTITSSVTAGFNQHGMPPPVCNPDLWPFDIETGVRVASKVKNLHSKFGHGRPLGVWVLELFANVRDGQTDRRTKATLIAPSLRWEHNKKICSARHSKHTRPGIGTLWCVHEVNWTTRSGVTAKYDFDIFYFIFSTFIVLFSCTIRPIYRIDWLVNKVVWLIVTNNSCCLCEVLFVYCRLYIFWFFCLCIFLIFFSYYCCRVTMNDK